MSRYQTLLETEFLGLSYSDLRKFGEVVNVQACSSDFVRKLAAAFDEVGVPYSARVAPNSAIYVLKQDADLAAEVRRALSRRLIQSAA